MGDVGSLRPHRARDAAMLDMLTGSEKAGGFAVPKHAFEPQARGEMFFSVLFNTAYIDIDYVLNNIDHVGMFSYVL